MRNCPRCELKLMADKHHVTPQDCIEDLKYRARMSGASEIKRLRKKVQEQAAELKRLQTLLWARTSPKRETMSAKLDRLLNRVAA